MTRADKLQIKTLIIGIVLASLTALAVYAIYGSNLFGVWPWIRFSLVVSTLTCLWAYAFWFGRLTGGKEDTLNPLFFALAVIPFDVILMYPGTAALGIYSDSNLYTLLATLEIVQGVGFYFLQREIQGYLKQI